MGNQIYATVRQDGRYPQDGDGKPFAVTLNTEYNQLADGFYIKGGLGGNYRPEDLEFYVKSGDDFELVKRKSWVK